MITLSTLRGARGVITRVVAVGVDVVAVVDDIVVVEVGVGGVGTALVSECLMFGCDMVRSRCRGLGAGVANSGMVLVVVAGVTWTEPGIGVNDTIVEVAIGGGGSAAAGVCCWSKSWATTADTIGGISDGSISRITTRQISAMSLAEREEGGDEPEDEEAWVVGTGE